MPRRKNYSRRLRQKKRRNLQPSMVTRKKLTLTLREIVTYQMLRNTFMILILSLEITGVILLKQSPKQQKNRQKSTIKIKYMNDCLGNGRKRQQEKMKRAVIEVLILIGVKMIFDKILLTSKDMKSIKLQLFLFGMHLHLEMLKTRTKR